MTRNVPADANQNNFGGKAHPFDNAVRIEPLGILSHWAAAGHMLQNYAGVDPEFERVVGEGWHKLYMRWLGFPLYYGLLNQGFGLKAGRELAGLLYLQHRPLVTHINDIEVNRPFQGQGYSYKLLSFAEAEAHRRKKKFMTLAVTISNERAVKLYLKTGYQPQHHDYYLLTRTDWSEAPIIPPLTTEQRKIVLQPLTGKRADANLRRFFQIEMRAGVPQFAPVWEAYYPPTPTNSNNGTSYGIYWDDAKDFGGHIDFFRHRERGRWRLYLPPRYWGTPQEQALIELLINESRAYNTVAVAFGTEEHHQQVADFMRHNGFNPRATERMLMIKTL